MIKVFTTRKDFDHYRQHLKDVTLGLVPTMGNLHQGHLSLIEKSTDENDHTIVTIFVNPKQFGPNEDFEKYPRTLDADLAKISALALLINAKKEIVVFAPLTNDEIYPAGFSSSISIGPLKDLLEGSIRSTHFDGVTTVVFRLFQIAKAHTAYFGQKDFQQCLIIKKMVADFELSINITVMPIIRNSQGLALSSRNQYLNDKEKQEALILPETLIEIEKLISNNQSYDDYIREKLANDSRWDYLKVLDAKDISSPQQQSNELVIIGAFKCGSTRLLDNRLVKIQGKISL
jgi:pantoate--beta-alanine ligase